MELLVGAAVVLVGAIIGALVAYRIGLHPVQQALVNALKDRVALLEAENVSLKAENVALKAEVNRLEGRVEKLEKAITDGVIAKVVVAPA